MFQSGIVDGHPDVITERSQFYKKIDCQEWRPQEQRQYAKVAKDIALSEKSELNSGFDSASSLQIMNAK